jgi:hypothetical protein
VISEHGVSIDPTKIAAVAEWPSPKNIKDIRSFLGLVGYYKKFVKNFGVIYRPLTELLKKQSIFLWTSVHEEAFALLKQALIQAPVLALPNVSRQFQIETNASDCCVGVVLMQKGHPLAFISKALGPRTKGLSTYENEYLAIMIAIDHWRAYLQLVGFTIFTDQKSLIHLDDQRLHTFWQKKCSLSWWVCSTRLSTKRVLIIGQLMLCLDTLHLP